MSRKRRRLGLAAGVTILSLVLPGVCSATILGTVPYNTGVWPLDPTATAWWQVNPFTPGPEGVCQAADGYQLWPFPGLPFTETRWRCTADGNDVTRVPVPVGSLVDFKKIEIEAISVLGSATPNMDTDYPHLPVRVRWDVNRDGSYESDQTSDFSRSQTGGSCAANFMGTWYCWARAYYLQFAHQFGAVGDVPISLTVDYGDGTSETATGLIQVVPDAVAASISPGKAWYLTGEDIPLDAGASTTLSGSPTAFAWDLATGSFAPATTSATRPTTFTTAGTKRVRVRAWSRGGSTGEATISIDVRPRPPAGELGVSLNSANPYTNDANVSLSLVWPAGATGARISNDGGFGPASTVTRDLAPATPWRLDNSVKGLYTKIVYVRFSGSGVDESRTYTDDIILDLTPPTITAASAVAGASANEMAVGSAVRVRVRAKDNRSGVRWMQVTSTKRAPGTAMKFTSMKTVRATGKHVFVRVRDGAGNWSPWRNVPIR